MPCCQLMLNAIMSTNATATKTPSWLHRLHVKKGISMPSNLQIDNLIYGDGSQPSLCFPVPTSSSCHHKNPLDIAKNQVQKATKLKRCKPPHNPTRQSPRFNRPHLSQPQPQPQPTTVVSNVSRIPSFDPIDTLSLNKAFSQEKAIDQQHIVQCLLHHHGRQY